MLLEVGLTNFKAFGSVTQTAPLSKITLIYGPNSSGKSSIIQALLMLKQSALLAGNAATIWGLITRGEWIDLGSYSALLHRHELDRQLGLNLTFGQSTNHVGIKMAFVGVTDVDQTGREYYEDSAILSRATYQMVRDGLPLVEAALESNGGSWWRALVSTTDASIDAKIVDYPNVHRFLPELKLLELELLLERNQATLPERERGLVRERARSRRLECSDARGRYQALRVMSAAELHQLPSLDRDLRRARENMRTLCRKSRPDLLRSLERSLTATQMLELKGIPNSFSEILSSVRYLGPLRSRPERLYRMSGAGSYVSGVRGEFVPHRLYYQPGLVTIVNKWFREFEIPYELRVEKVGDMAITGEHIALVLEDANTGARVTLSDVGFGINQVLPVIVEGVDWFAGGENRVLCVEQPEIHIHPRLQARLADLMIETIHGRSEKQWIVETHSEMLVLRLQRRIREGKLDSSDVSVLYVNPDAENTEGSAIRILRLDGKGDFIDYWPDGFFEESFQELMA